MPDTSRAREMRRRANALAQPLPQADTSEQLPIIEFTLGSEHYAIDLAYVGEVRELSNLTSLPGTPQHIAGVIAVRGRIVSVMDLKLLFDLSQTALTGREQVIILHQDSMEFGLLVDKVTGVRNLPTAQIHPPLPTLHGAGARYVHGVTASSLIVLDGNSILSDDSLVVDEEVKV